ncbi:flagellar hook-length control protein FliK [Variovorax sp. ZT4R33]|uniref:flagellar hook-length control protein FliK n=1 Tax=Variovorax sp. ZT4R33 TaxID=3443743 RepID=UPI003F45C5F6
MPALVSPSLVSPGLPSTSSPARSRAADEPQGRSFHATLDRSRAAQAEAAGDSKVDGVAPRPGSRRGAAAQKDDAPAEMPNLAFFTPAVPAELAIAAARAGAHAQTAGAVRDAAAATQRTDAQTALAGAGAAADGSTAAAATTTTLPASAPGAEAAQAAALADGSSPAAASDDGALQAARKALASAAAQADATTAAPVARAESAAAPAASVDPSLLGAALASAVPGTPAAAARTTRTDATRDSAAGATTTGAAAGQADAAKTDPLQALAAAGAEAGFGSDAGAADAEPDAAPAAWMAAQAGSTGGTERSAATDNRVPVLSLAPPVDSDAWGPALGQQMLRMSASGMHTAHLNLNPANLGPLQITLKLGDDQAQAMFVSAHEGVRKAVESALPQLRTTLAEHGISLGQTAVGGDTRQPAGQGGFAGDQPSGRSNGQGGSSYPGSARATVASSDAVPAAPLRSVRTEGTVDTFA